MPEVAGTRTGAAAGARPAVRAVGAVVVGAVAGARAVVRPWPVCAGVGGVARRNDGDPIGGSARRAGVVGAGAGRLGGRPARRGRPGRCPRPRAGRPRWMWSSGWPGRPAPAARPATTDNGAATAGAAAPARASAPPPRTPHDDRTGGDREGEPAAGEAGAAGRPPPTGRDTGRFQGTESSRGAVGHRRGQQDHARVEAWPRSAATRAAPSAHGVLGLRGRRPRDRRRRRSAPPGPKQIRVDHRRAGRRPARSPWALAPAPAATVAVTTSSPGFGADGVGGGPGATEDGEHARSGGAGPWRRPLPPPRPTTARVAPSCSSSRAAYWRATASGSVTSSIVPEPEGVGDPGEGRALVGTPPGGVGGGLIDKLTQPSRSATRSTTRRSRTPSSALRREGGAVERGAIGSRCYNEAGCRSRPALGSWTACRSASSPTSGRDPSRSRPGPRAWPRCARRGRRRRPARRGWDGRGGARWCRGSGPRGGSWSVVSCAVRAPAIMSERRAAAAPGQWGHPTAGGGGPWSSPSAGGQAGGAGAGGGGERLRGVRAPRWPARRARAGAR